MKLGAEKEQFMLRHIKGLLGLFTVVVVVSLFSASLTLGQTGTSGINGIITDAQGRAVAGAKVTLTNLGTNATRTTQTTESGAYAFDLIPPADYRIDIEATGFRKSVVDNAKALI